MTEYTELYNAISPYLHANEDVLWIGRPTSANMSKRSMFPSLFAVFFMCFAVFWMASASRAGGPFFLFGLPFLLVGAGLFYKTTFGQKNGLKNSVYAVTDTRAIILVYLPRTGVNCVEYVFSNLQGVSLENVQYNVGTIRFDDVYVYDYSYTRRGRSGAAYSPERELTTAFVMIEDVHTVYHLISERIGRQ